MYHRGLLARGDDDTVEGETVDLILKLGAELAMSQADPVVALWQLESAPAGPRDSAPNEANIENGWMVASYVWIKI